MPPSWAASDEAERYARLLLGSRRPTRMPFGRFKGVPFSEVPTADLEAVVYLNGAEPLRSAVLNELILRHPDGPPSRED